MKEASASTPPVRRHRVSVSALGLDPASLRSAHLEVLTGSPTAAGPLPLGLAVVEGLPHSSRDAARNAQGAQWLRTWLYELELALAQLSALCGARRKKSSRFHGDHPGASSDGITGRAITWVALDVLCRSSTSDVMAPHQVSLR